MPVDSKAKQSFVQAVKDTYPEGSSVLRAMLQFAEDGVDVNDDREKARLVVQHMDDLIVTLKKSWNLYL
jgi:hypothetical protein